MKQITNYIKEGLRINKNIIIKKSPDNWSIENAEDGDFVNWNGTELYFIYKCLNKELDKPKNLSSDTIIYHAAYSFSIKTLNIGPNSGVGDIKYPKNFSLASEEKKEDFIEVLKDKGYEWDEDKKELIKIT